MKGYRELWKAVEEGELSPKAALLFCWLHGQSYIGGKTGRITRTTSQIALALRTSAPSIHRSLRELEAQGYIVREDHRRAGQTILLWNALPFVIKPNASFDHKETLCDQTNTSFDHIGSGNVIKPNASNDHIAPCNSPENKETAPPMCMEGKPGNSSYKLDLLSLNEKEEGGGHRSAANASPSLPENESPKKENPEPPRPSLSALYQKAKAVKDAEEKAAKDAEHRAQLATLSEKVKADVAEVRELRAQIDALSSKKAKDSVQ